MESVEKLADALCEKAEHTGKLSFVTLSNSFRRTTKEKQKEVAELEKALNEKLFSLKLQYNVRN